MRCSVLVNYMHVCDHYFMVTSMTIVLARILNVYYQNFPYERKPINS